jgi:hypothetical protein
MSSSTAIDSLPTWPTSESPNFDRSGGVADVVGRWHGLVDRADHHPQPNAAQSPWGSGCRGDCFGRVTDSVVGDMNAAIGDAALGFPGRVVVDPILAVPVLANPSFGGPVAFGASVKAGAAHLILVGLADGR